MKANCPVVDIDVGKNLSYYCVLTPSGGLYLGPTKATNDAKGLAKMIGRPGETEEALGTRPAIVLESTGHYSERLVCFFIRNGYKVFLINPLQSHSIKNVSIRKVKTDKMDCQEIARLFFMLDLREYKMLDDDRANLKILTRAYHLLGRKRVRLINRLTSQLDQSWPGFTEVLAVSSKTALSLLFAYPAPAQLVDAPRKDIVALIRSESRRGPDYAKKKYKALRQCAHDALTFGTQLDGHFACTEIYAGMLQEINEKLTQLEDQIKAFAIKVPAVKLLKTIPGIGPRIAATLAAEIGDIDRFDNAKHVFCEAVWKVYRDKKQADETGLPVCTPSFVSCRTGIYPGKPKQSVCKQGDLRLLPK